MFENHPIDINKLPLVEEVKFNSLDSKYKTVVSIRLSVVTFCLLLLSFSPYVLQYLKVILLSSTLLLLIGILGIIISILMCSTTLKGVGMKGYALREHDIVYKSGIITRTQTIIPFNRVQHVVVYESALLRVFNLCTVEFFTAGGALGDLKISGISKEEGDRLKAYVVQKISKSIHANVGEQIIEEINETK